MDEQIISRIKQMVYIHRKEYDKSPKFLVCNYDTKMELLASTWSPHFLDRDKNMTLPSGSAHTISLY